MKITRSALFEHVKSYEGKDNFEGFLGFIDSPIRDLRVIKMPQGRVRLKYIDQHDNIHRVDVGPGEEEEISFPF
ncbi:hypothetical protein [Methanomassiliicoccus luminyensis]|jgi:hypothetical protein|uniref:hypothetical protein n=1 Tax=Methanomassiliicoccus luminyensis TaxID=1080712 RepID=UPI00035F8CC8|nr:hypothetical protein [Methanomassiliicoccus luminyensis]